MDMSVYEISLFGMKAEKARLEAATHNIALANMVSGSADQLGSIKNVDLNNNMTFLDAMKEHQNGSTSLISDRSKEDSVISIYKPEHSSADNNGFIYKLDINMTEQMLTLNSSTRAFEANVKAFNAYKSMNAKSLEIGK